ncbi:ilvC [Mytilus coruscus]|uniref:IlvC n=1 Tax=Mytilus coruscus TaxID=42192 RepID=A0A6J7ZW85_MYTCO|nr:ilvC [Mytilus coruscus]
MEDFTKQLLDQYVHNAPDGDGDGGVSKVIELLVFKKDEKLLSDFTGFSIPIKPTWPYEELILIDGNNDSENLERKRDSSDLTSHKTDTSELPIIESSILRKLIFKSQDIVEVNAEYGNFVRQSVKSFINNSLNELKDKYLMFKDSFLVEVGSMAEGTRIMEPSEMDFLIALPELANEKSCNLYFTEAILSIFIQDERKCDHG